MLAELQCQIERITYKNEENGFTIARVKVYGDRDLITVVGNLMTALPGEVLKLKGEWSNHPKFGEQFKIVHYQTVMPGTVYGIQKYLGSGLVKGIGPKMAKRIVKQFGKDTLHVIENDIMKLSQVDGIGDKRIHMIKAAWEEQKDIREVMVFLQSHDVSSGYATKIFKQYGKDSIKIVRGNPYRLATDILGIGFVTADKIAESMGFAKDSPERAKAGVLFVLNQLADDGHVYYPYELLIEKSMVLLTVAREIIKTAIAALVSDGHIIIEDINFNVDEFRENNKAVYLSTFHVCETQAARKLKFLLNTGKTIRKIDIDKAIDWVQAQLHITLDDKQVNAVRLALTTKVLVITGGPGTGKTTIINAILKIYNKLNVSVLLAAPTGRAAKRMTETTGHASKTIHRLLEYSVKNGGFQKNDKYPLDCDLLIIDEASMIDTVLMHHLLKAVPVNATLIVVGDVNQLPSVGAGNVLKDIIDSGRIPVAMLDRIFRQARASRIIVNAHEINRGLIPSFRSDDKENDCYFIQKELSEEVLLTILELVTKRIPARFGFDAVEDIQVLTPMHRGIVGAGNLNKALQEALNTQREGLEIGTRIYRAGDKVMQIRNNYDKDVFNGDIGKIIAIDREVQKVLVSFDDRTIDYDFSDLDELVLAYAISVHKSQGSEYPCVIIPVLTQHYILLQRNLIYTAITRGRRLVVFVGTRKAMAIAVKNDKPEKRYTFLRHRLCE
ncbi:MAG: ATP-dependent RecD-like DNA helicase [Proteobacteria bacterium]|nr:ATP-dependent RecD-like DNA helicase [Pseudomonadota bacterium]